MGQTELRAMCRDDHPEVARLIHASTNAWYVRHALPPVFPCEPADVELFCSVYEALDPGCCVLAHDDGVLVGSCFYHPRATHVSLGIMNVHPAAFGRGIARRLLAHVVDVARGRSLPVRLVSSALNLDSFSLYTRAGFTPYALFQDLALAVPASGFPARPPGLEHVRDAVPADVPAMVALERELAGIERERDHRFFLADDSGAWHVSVCERGGSLSGFLVSVGAPANRMLGPGVARDDATALALIARGLDRHRGEQPVFLLPSDRPALVHAAYGWGARNIELHVAQVLGPVPVTRGVVMPTFLPETG